MLEPLPFTHSDRLVVLEEQVAEFRDIYPKLPVTANHFVNWERNSHSFQSMAAIEQKSVPLGTDEHPIQVKVVRATSGIFSVLGATPQIGRPFAEQEAQPGRDCGGHSFRAIRRFWEKQSGWTGSRIPSFA
jgi:hypothetical protein